MPGMSDLSDSQRDALTTQAELAHEAHLADCLATSNYSRPFMDTYRRERDAFLAALAAHPARPVS